MSKNHKKTLEKCKCGGFLPFAFNSPAFSLTGGSILILYLNVSRILDPYLISSQTIVEVKSLDFQL